MRALPPLLLAIFLLPAPAPAESLYDYVRPEIPRHRDHMVRRLRYYRDQALGEFSEPAAEAAPARARPASNSGEAEPVIPFAYPAARRLVLDPSALGLCMAEATAREFPRFSFDLNHMECTRLIEGELYQYTRPDKPTMMEYLSGDPRRKCDYTSGREERLRAWVRAQPDNSVDPLSIYRQSLRLNDGNVWNALLTVHQVLRQEARFFDLRRYRYPSTAERSREFFNKLVDLRGDLRERGAGYVGDHAGSWYRIWGAMLFRLLPVDRRDVLAGFSTEERACLDQSQSRVDRRLRQFADNLTATMVFFGDEVILKMHVEEDKTGKFSLDRRAAHSMGHLVRGLREASLGRPTGAQLGACEARSYLQPALLRR